MEWTMAKRVGISLVSTVGGLMQWKLGNGSLVELNTNKCDSNVREQAMFAGFHRAISNIGAGKDKENWLAIEREMLRRIRGMLAGMWKTAVGGYGFADHVEAIIRIAAEAGAPRTYDAVADALMKMSHEQRTEHAAKPLVRKHMAAIAAERAALAADEDDDATSGDVLAGL